MMCEWPAWVFQLPFQMNCPSSWAGLNLTHFVKVLCLPLLTFLNFLKLCWCGWLYVSNTFFLPVIEMWGYWGLLSFNNFKLPSHLHSAHDICNSHWNKHDRQPLQPVNTRIRITCWRTAVPDQPSAIWDTGPQNCKKEAEILQNRPNREKAWLASASI